jgi:NAD(P)-dependent dehydrogenase (short-subunit alcohol dehydrogenase family)
MPSRKLALVTGANRGIGFEIVRQLSKHDFRVVLTARNRNAGERAVAKLNGNVNFQTLDVSDEASIQRAAKEFGDNHDRLDVLVNNAGIYPDEGSNILTIARQHFKPTHLAPYKWSRLSYRICEKPGPRASSTSPADTENSMVYRAMFRAIVSRN